MGPFTEDDLLAHIRGEATTEMSREIESAMAENPALRAEVATMRGLRAAVKEAGTGPAPGEFAWRKLEAEIRRETTSEHRTQRSGWWRAAAVFLGIAVLGQGAYIAWVGSARDDAPFRTVTQAADQHVLAIGLAPGAGAGAVTALLRQSRGRIIDGPGATGLFRVAFANEADLDAARDLYTASELVDLVADQ
ncbi:MAG: hypothetical protein AAGB15_00590 [Pseudomonadota bacterium]